MAGYSRLMEQDEEGVLERQKRHRRELIDPAIARRGGRIVKTTGDGMLAEFAAAENAVRCAIDIQNAMAERERASPIDRRNHLSRRDQSRQRRLRRRGRVRR
jgi:class 3 adenylate cyclase